MNSTENIYENYHKEKNIIKSKKKVDWYWENIETKRDYALLIENKEEEPVNYELIINHTFLE